MYNRTTQWVGVSLDLPQSDPQKSALELTFLPLALPDPQSKVPDSYEGQVRSRAFDPVTRLANPYLKNKLKFKIKIIDFEFYLFKVFDILLALFLSALPLTLPQNSWTLKPPSSHVPS